MKIETIETPTPETIAFFNQKIDEFNHARWEINEKFPLAVTLTDASGEVLAGSTGRTFGLWFLLDTLWVSESLRGQNRGSQVLAEIESAAKARGCQFVLLDTLEFQARPFYEKHGYKLQWTQKQYPKSGEKYFMVKELT